MSTGLQGFYAKNPKYLTTVSLSGLRLIGTVPLMSFMIMSLYLRFYREENRFKQLQYSYYILWLLPFFLYIGRTPAIQLRPARELCLEELSGQTAFRFIFLTENCK